MTKPKVSNSSRKNDPTKARTRDTKRSSREQSAKLEAIDRVQAVIEFDTDGVVLTANANFLSAMGYTLEEIKGKHHRMFVEPQYAQSEGYQEFWRRLNSGQFESGEMKRIGKGGREVWLLASYNPIFDERGRVFKIVKFATDITAQKTIAADYSGQIAAIGKSQAVIEFDMSGNVLRANQLFLATFGYGLDEVVGRHHSMFVEPSYAQSPEYREFWRKLNAGEYESGEFKRLGKRGREVWIQASYNPILDLNGRPFKVVKYASDVTQQKLRAADFAGQIAAIGKSQAVIEFDLNGNVLTANEGFLKTLGYTLPEIVGHHHRMFVDSSYANSPEYRDFWARLSQGRYDANEYKRIAKNGEAVWIQASYNPIMDMNGRPFKIVKYATDITQQKRAFLDMMQAVDALSKGDLTTKLDGHFVGDFAKLRDQLNSSFGTLSSMVHQIGGAVDAIRSAASDISEGNGNLNTRTQEQSSALEETASSLEELTATVKQNAGNATHANQLAAGARGAAESGGQVVGEAVSAMSAITDSSRKVADIIGVIEQIAFQTNMLALNAAVEAARAGDQGRGFAVVASEVRNLAQRSATAAREIKALIEDSKEKVEQGAKLVNRSGETLANIVSAVKKVSDIIGEIDAASEQQASGIDQINSAVAQMDKNTQQNAAMVEQSTAAAESMTEQARALAELVRFFKVGADDASDGGVGREQAVVVPRAPALPRNQPARTTAARSETNMKDKHAGKPIFSTRRPPPPAADNDWKEF